MVSSTIKNKTELNYLILIDTFLALRIHFYYMTVKMLNDNNTFYPNIMKKILYNCFNQLLLAWLLQHTRSCMYPFSDLSTSYTSFWLSKFSHVQSHLHEYKFTHGFIFVHVNAFTHGCSSTIGYDSVQIYGCTCGNIFYFKML